MNYSESIFGKNLTELTFSDIENYFSEEKEETNYIEFKSYSVAYGNFNKNIEGVIRGICAFLNSDGGILIWGSPEGTKVDGRQEKVFMGSLSPVTELKEKDWFINKISDSITPLPIGINMHTLENNGGYIYIFEIQKSTYSPHQFKSTYFARLDGQTKPAPHYLIEALFKKISFPQIEGFIKPVKIDHDGTYYFLDIEIYMFNFSEFQNEENVSFRLMCPQGIFAKSQDARYSKMYTYQGHQLVYENIIDVLHFGAPNHHSEKILLKPYEVQTKFENKVELILTFGGKTSPLKTSQYTIDLSRVNWNMKDEPNYLFAEIMENKLFAEIQKEKNNTREAFLKLILKR